VLEGEADAGTRQRDAGEDFVAVAELGGLGAQELAARRGVEVQVGDRHRGARRARRGLDRPGGLAFGMDRARVRRAAAARGDRQARDRGDRGERFAAKSHRRHALEVLQAGNLAGGVAREGERQLACGDALAVVLHLDALDAARLEADGHRCGAGVQAVLEQLLQHRGRPLHHLAGGDLAHQQLGQEPNLSRLRAHAAATSTGVPPVMRTSSS
jgi:hypothetical protein